MIRWLIRESNDVKERISLVYALPWTKYIPGFRSMPPLRSININSHET